MNLRQSLGISLLILATIHGTALGQDPAVSLGPVTETQVQEPAGGIFCEGATLVQWDDDSFENGIAWSGDGVVAEDPDYYGSWAECYDSDFVCGIQFLFAQVGGYAGQTMNVFVWQSEGSPPVPGNVICTIMDVDPGPPSNWPDVSVHNVLVCCESHGTHFSGFWPNWPGDEPGWFMATDENGFGNGCPRTNIAPGIGYPTGWQHPNVVPAFENTRSLGIREYSGLGGDCIANPVQRTTWGSIKALY
jgi:hypothetical protein